MRSGIAGINIVSAYITMTAMQLKTRRVFQAYAGILIDVDITSDDDFEDESVKQSDRNLLTNLYLSLPFVSFNRLLLLL
jgi:hypothetical protein